MLSSTIKELLCVVNLVLEFGLLGFECIVDLGNWGKVISSPLGSGIMELLLGVNAHLGNVGGVENGLGSSGLDGGGSSDSGYVFSTQFLGGQVSGSLLVLCFGEGISGSDLRTSEWGNGLGEILEECTGTGEILAGSGDFLTSNCLPSLGSLEFLVGSGSELLLASLDNLGGTNGSAGPAAI